VIICTNNDNLSILVSRDFREIHTDVFFIMVTALKRIFGIFLALGSPIRPLFSIIRPSQDPSQITYAIFIYKVKFKNEVLP